MGFYIRYPLEAGNVNASVGLDGAPIPTSATLIGAEDPSGNLAPAQVDAQGNLKVNIAAGTITAENPSVSLVGDPVPTYATNVGGKDPSGNLIDSTFDASGNQNVNVQASVLPTGAATQTTLVTVSTTLGSILLDLTNGTQITQITGTVPLPTGAATAANQSTEITALQAIEANQTNGTQETQITGTVPLPTGAATAANQATEIADLATIITNTTGLATQATLSAVDANQTNGTQTSRLTDGTNTAAVKASSTAPVATDPALVVAVSPNSPAPKGTAGRSLANAPTVTTYATPITSSGYTTIIASTTSATNLVEIFDSSGVALFFAIGAAASEVNQFVIYPGGNGQVPLAIPAGSRVSYKAVSASATGSTAYNVLNLYT